jgi:hypothetical protein
MNSKKYLKFVRMLICEEFYVLYLILWYMMSIKVEHVWYVHQLAWILKFIIQN